MTKQKFISLIGCIFLSACATQQQYLNFYAVDENKFSSSSGARYIEQFDTALLDNKHLAIGYVTAEQVLRECPTGMRCKHYPAEPPLEIMLEQHASAKGGSLITHTEKRYLKWQKTESRCLKWESVTVGYDKNKKPRKQRRCTESDTYKVDMDTVVLHGLVWRKDHSFDSTPEERLQQITTWKDIIAKYGDNCLVVSPSAQDEHDSMEFMGKIRDVILITNREMMRSVKGLSLAVAQTPLNDIYAEINKPVAEIPCKIQQKPFFTQTDY